MKLINWMQLTAGTLGVLGAFAGASYAQTAPTVTVYANGITAPAGTVEVANSLWVADHLQGFCRLDVPVGGGTAVINAATCVTTAISAGQPSFDGNYLYLPDNSSKSRGVWRLRYSASTGRFITSTTSPNRPILVATNGNARPTATTLAGGNLYIGSLKNGNILRVTNPAGTPVTTVVGRTSDGRGAASLASLNGNLYIAEGTGVSAIPTNANELTACGRPCIASLLPSNFITLPAAIASNGESLFIADNTNEIIKYTPGTDPDFPESIEEIYVPGGSFRLPSGLGISNGATVLYVGDDPTDGNGVAQGRIWKVEPVPVVTP